MKLRDSTQGKEPEMATVCGIYLVRFLLGYLSEGKHQMLVRFTNIYIYIYIRLISTY